MIKLTKKDLGLLGKLAIEQEIKILLSQIQDSIISKEVGMKICKEKILDSFSKIKRKNKISVNTLPTIENSNSSSFVEHEATTSALSKDQLFYLQCRGLSVEDSANLVINGFVKEVMLNLPMEFAIEAQKLLELKLEGSIG